MGEGWGEGENDALLVPILKIMILTNPQGRAGLPPSPVTWATDYGRPL